MQTVAVLFGLVIAFTGCAIGWTIAGERRRRNRSCQSVPGQPEHQAESGSGVGPI